MKKISIKFPHKCNCTDITLVSLSLFVVPSMDPEIGMCSEDQVQCNGTSQKCISVTWLCDGDNDCGDYEDEQNCTGRFEIHEDQRYIHMNGNVSLDDLEGTPQHQSSITID